MAANLSEAEKEILDALGLKPEWDALRTVMTDLPGRIRDCTDRLEAGKAEALHSPEVQAEMRAMREGVLEFIARAQLLDERAEPHTAQPAVRKLRRFLWQMKTMRAPAVPLDPPRVVR